MIAPYLMNCPHDDTAKVKLVESLSKEARAENGISKDMDDQQFKTIGLQFKALCLVGIDYLKNTAGGMGLYWTLTAAGEKVMMNERIVKKAEG